MGYVRDSHGQGTGMLADTNGDGLDDYVMPFRGGGSLLRIATYLGQPNGGFNSQPITTSNSNYGYVKDKNRQGVGKLADTNGDGRADYVMPFTGGNGLLSLAIYQGQPNGGFNNLPISTSNSNYGFVTDMNGQGSGMMADVNGDGRADYVMPFTGGNGLLSLATYLVNSSGGFNSLPMTTKNYYYRFFGS